MDRGARLLELSREGLPIPLILRLFSRMIVLPQSPPLSPLKNEEAQNSYEKIGVYPRKRSFENEAPPSAENNFLFSTDHPRTQFFLRA